VRDGSKASQGGLAVWRCAQKADQGIFLEEQAKPEISAQITSISAFIYFQTDNIISSMEPVLISVFTPPESTKAFL
jgi:hypothetical protein